MDMMMVLKKVKMMEMKWVVKMGLMKEYEMVPLSVQWLDIL
jgi:hypothetical protein